MIYAYSFQNKKRDLSDILSTVVKDEPRFISLFGRKRDAVAQKHEWLEDQIVGRSVTVSGTVTNLACPMSAADLGKIKVGTLLTKANDSALFRVNAIASGNATLALVAANGSATTTPASGDILNIVSTPMGEGTDNGDGEDTARISGSDYNCTQIFRKEIVLSGSALAVDVYGNVDNNLNRQTAFAMQELSRDLNRVALFGRRVVASATAKGEAGGLYFFGTQTGGLSVNAGTNTLDSYIINDAAQAILGAGGDPSTILCNPGQARVLSAEFKDSLQIVRSDDRRGAYVAHIINEVNGRTMTILADPDMPDTDVWVLDSAGLGLSNLKGRALGDEDATEKGFDGIKRVALGELTFEFKNAKQRLCRIYGLTASATALATLRQ